MLAGNHLNLNRIVVFMLCCGIISISLLSGAEPGKSIMVIPLKVTPHHEKAHQWLGRAVSFYLTYGLRCNSIAALSDSYTAAILEKNHIMFPYSITKATIMQLARESQINRIIWGEIALDGKGNEGTGPDKSLIQLQLCLIDLSDYSQTYVPVIKGPITDFYKIKNELLTSIIKMLNPGNQETHQLHYPQFKLNHRHYEIFIKSLLIKDTSRRIQLLEDARKSLQGEDSALLDFELAKLYFNSGRLETAETFLEEISEDRETNLLFKDEKTFLNGLIAYAREDNAAAITHFNSLLPDHRFDFEIHHNLGVIYFKMNDNETADMHFRCALEERKDPETWLNLLHVLLYLDNPLQAAEQLNQALRLYPQEEQLVEMFSYFVSQAENQSRLFITFQNYIPNLYLREDPPKVTLKPRNPFDFQFHPTIEHHNTNESNEFLTVPNGLQGLGSEDIDSGIERLEELLEINPFEPEYYRLISSLYVKKKKFYQGELHAQALIFLEKTRENYLHLVNIYKSTGKKEKAKETKKEMIKRYKY